MTEAILAEARCADPSQDIAAWTSLHGPASIQGAADGDAATPPLLELIGSIAPGDTDAIIIGCFDDTGLAEAAKIAPCPVIGIGQAAYAYAALRQWRFSVVTTLPVSIPVLEDNISNAGLDRYLAKVRASDVPVLALEDDPATAGDMVLAEANRAVTQDDIDALILGCAGMVHVADRLRRAIDLPVIDPVTCAVRCLPWLTNVAGAASSAPS